MRILVDCDGVVCDFATAYHNAALTELGKQYDGDIHDRKTWDVGDAMELTETERRLLYVPLTHPGVGANLPAYQPAIEAVVEMSKFAEIVFVTAPFPFSPTWMWDRNIWLEKQFPTLDYKVIHTADKHLIVGDVLIDDKVCNIESWADAMRKLGRFPKPILWGWPFNEGQTPKKAYRFTDWADVLKLIRPHVPGDEERRRLEHRMEYDRIYYDDADT